MPIPAFLLAAKPIMAAVWGVLSKIPMWVWVALAAVIAVWLYGSHERGEGRKERDKHWEGVISEMRATHAAAINAKRMEVSDWVLKVIAERDAAAAKSREADLAYEARVEEANNRRRTVYVTKVAAARCDLTRGVVLAFNDGAAGANGEERGADASAAQPAAEVVDAPAKVSLDHFTSAIAATQTALGQCRRQVLDWQAHWALVTHWYDGLRVRMEAVP